MTDKKETGPVPNPSHAEPPMMKPNFIEIKSATVENLAGYLASMNLPNMYSQDTPLLVVPETITPRSIEEFMPRPARIRKSIRFTEATSFLDYFGAFHTRAFPRTFVTGDDAGMKFLTIFDYAMPPGKDENAVPLWGDHRAYLELAYHPDYAELRKRNATWMSQEEFALFVEEHTHLFKSPTGADMLEMAQELKGSRTASWQSGKRLANNQVRLEYIETVDAKSVRGDLIVPEYLEMETPMFKGYEAQPVKAAFSWKMDGDKVRFSYRLLTRIAERKAAEEVKTSIAVGTKLPVYSVAEFGGVTQTLRPLGE